MASGRLDGRWVLGACAVLILSGPAACAVDRATGSDGGTSTGATTTGATTTDATTTGATTTGATTTDVTPTTGGSMSGTTTSEPTTTPSESTGGADEGDPCDPKLQDCKDGLKCTAYEHDPNEPPGWDRNRCVKEPPNGAGIGEECQIDPGESVFSGLDNCAKGSMCLNFDFETGTGGTCIEFCDAMGECPGTAGGEAICIEGSESVLPICLATCDPLVQDCPNGQACYGDASLPVFICFSPDTGMNPGTDNSPCEFINACAPGFSCQPADMVDGCEPGTTRCCTPFCSLSGGGGTCAPPEECVPFFPNEPPEGLEDVGVCMVAP